MRIREYFEYYNATLEKVEYIEKELKLYLSEVKTKLSEKLMDKLFI